MKLKDRLNRFLDEIEVETKETPAKSSEPRTPTPFHQELQKELEHVSAQASESSFVNIDLREVDTNVSVIDHDARVFGDITTSESLRINGVVIGNIVCSKHLELFGDVEGDLKVGSVQLSNSVLRGNISCEEDVMVDSKSEIIGDCWNDNISMRGVIKGNIYSRGKIHLYPSAEVSGNVSGSNIVIDDGATIQGNIKIKRD